MSAHAGSLISLPIAITQYIIFVLAIILPFRSIGRYEESLAGTKIFRIQASSTKRIEERLEEIDQGEDQVVHQSVL